MIPLPSSLWLYLIGGVALIAMGFGGGFMLANHLSQDQIVQLSGNLARAQDNITTLNKGIDACNASVTDSKAAGDKMTAAANVMVAQAATVLPSIQKSIAAMKAVASTGESCPVADAKLKAAFQ